MHIMYLATGGPAKRSAVRGAHPHHSQLAVLDELGEDHLGGDGGQLRNCARPDLWFGGHRLGGWWFEGRGGTGLCRRWRLRAPRETKSERRVWGEGLEGDVVTTFGAIS